MVLRERKQNPSRDITSIFEKSMLTGIPEIAKAGNWKKKLLRIAEFIFCVGGFTYQILSFFDVYWKYQTVIDVQVENPAMADKPSFTVCLNYGIKTNEYCEKYELKFREKYGYEYCEKLQEYMHGMNICECVPRLCDESKKPFNISFPTMHDYMKMTRLPWEEVKPFLANQEDILSKLEEKDLYSDEESIEYSKNSYRVEIPSIGSQNIRGTCFTRDSLIKKPHDKPSKVYTMGSIQLSLDMLETDLPPFLKRPLMSISIHSPYHVENPFRYGVHIAAAHRNNIRISKVVKKLLPPPYETGCRDYLTTWKQRGGTGPVTSKECIQECLRNYSMATHGCVVYGIDYPAFDTICYKVEDYALIKKNEKCIDTCKPACYQESYDIKHDVEEIEENACSENFTNLQNTAYVNINLNGMETTVFTSRPAYEPIEVLGYVGGYIGIWLGISLIAVFDFGETVVVLMQYSLRRMRRERNENENLNGGTRTY